MSLEKAQVALKMMRGYFVEKTNYKSGDLILVDDVEMVLQQLAEEIEKAIKSELRNCEIYADEQSAWEAFSNARQGADSSTEEYEKWLFEKAEVNNGKF